MNLYELKQNLGEAGALITFSGSFSHGIIEELGTAIRAYLESQTVRKSAMMDVFSVYIEAAQNVRNYAGSATEGVLVIAKRAERYEVHSGNVIDSEHVRELTERLERLAELDKVALKALYKEQLRQERPSAGAGLGLIEMARRASQPLSWEFRPLADGRSFFSLRVVV